MGRKRKYRPDDRLEAFTKQLKQLHEALFDEGGNELAGLAILHLSQEARMTIADLGKLKASTPSFSAAKWETVSPALGLRADLGITQLNRFIVPIAILPPLFHRELMKNALRWMDVYQEPPSHKREEAPVRLLEAWYVPICSLFNGRLVDKPETPMPETPETSGGEIEHEVFLFSNLILLVRDAWDYYAQVLLELVSAMKLNRDIDLDPQPPIYAMLSDLRDFYFLSYDGTMFRCMVQIPIQQHPRTHFMKGMAQGMSHAAVEKRSIRRGNEGNVSQHKNFSTGTPVIEKVTRQVPRPSLVSLSKALLKAREAQTIFGKPDFMSEDTWERHVRRGMDVLNESLKHLLKIGSHADWDEDDSNIKIGSIMDQIIKAHRSGVMVAGIE